MIIKTEIIAHSDERTYSLVDIYMDPTTGNFVSHRWLLSRGDGAILEFDGLFAAGQYDCVWFMDTMAEHSRKHTLINMEMIKCPVTVELKHPEIESIMIIPPTMRLTSFVS